MKLLVTGAYNLEISERTELEELGFEITFVQNEQESINIDVSQFEIVVCNSLFQFNNIEDFKKLKYIQVTSVGIDRLPMEYITDNNIKLFNARDTYSVPMAEWSILKILEIYKNSKFSYKRQENKEWIKDRNIQELSGSTISIIGYGTVGKEIAKRLKGFDVKIIGVGLNKNDKEKYLDEFSNVLNLRKVLSISDVVIISLPLNEKTENLFDYELMNEMKDKSLLMNLSRGRIINTDDLIRVLNEGKFLGCALDVFDLEPLPKCHPLWNYDEVYITPHESFISNKNKKRLFEVIKENLNTLRS